MTTEPTADRVLSPDEASLEDAYLAIPDETNPAIIDARKTYVIIMIGTVLFAGAAIVYVLL